MGEVISSRRLTIKSFLGLPHPIVISTHKQNFFIALSDAGYQTICLNLPLAKALISRITYESVSDITSVILDLMPDSTSVYLTDFEILFDPKYNLNVIKLFCEISRRKKLVVQWCGIFNGESLIFAEQGYEDYAKYKVSDYDIVCVN